MQLPQIFVKKNWQIFSKITTHSLILTVSCSFLTACDYFKKTNVDNSMTVEKIANAMPNRGQNKTAWANDITEIFNTLKIERNPQNVCSVVAVIDQESNFKADPPVPNLGATSLKAMHEKLDDKLGKVLADIFRKMLKNEPTPQNSFEKQILKVQTEQQLDQLYHRMFDYFSQKYYTNKLTNVTKLVGADVAEKIDPITTLGSMQVSVQYAHDHQRVSGSNEELRRDLYSQYGGLYYGIHRLMLYKANYSDSIYRFADYNSGMYSSRNAAFQKMLAELSKQKIDLDGDLLSYNSNAQSQSEKALNAMTTQGIITLTPRQIHSDLGKEKTQNFENTETYRTVGSLYKMKTGKNPLVAIMPQVVISGTKLSKDYNTNWYATGVNKRYLACLAKAK